MKLGLMLIFVLFTSCGGTDFFGKDIQAVSGSSGSGGNSGATDPGDNGGGGMDPKKCVPKDKLPDVDVKDYVCDSGKYMFCHYPPGRTEYDDVDKVYYNNGAHVIIIDESAVETHLRVGGYLMNCKEHGDLKAGDMCDDTWHLCTKDKKGKKKHDDDDDDDHDDDDHDHDDDDHSDD